MSKLTIKIFVAAAYICSANAFAVPFCPSPFNFKGAQNGAPVGDCSCGGQTISNVTDEQCREAVERLMERSRAQESAQGTPPSWQDQARAHNAQMGSAIGYDNAATIDRAPAKPWGDVKILDCEVQSVRWNSDYPWNGNVYSLKTGNVIAMSVDKLSGADGGNFFSYVVRNNDGRPFGVFNVLKSAGTFNYSNNTIDPAKGRGGASGTCTPVNH